VAVRAAPGAVYEGTIATIASTAAAAACAFASRSLRVMHCLPVDPCLSYCASSTRRCCTRSTTARPCETHASTTGRQSSRSTTRWAHGWASDRETLSSSAVATVARTHWASEAAWVQAVPRCVARVVVASTSVVPRCYHGVALADCLCMRLLVCMPSGCHRCAVSLLPLRVRQRVPHVPEVQRVCQHAALR
jgi:hypothetical protein